MNRQIEVHIEELVLHGFDRRDRFRIGQAVERALTQLLAEQGATPMLLQNGSIPAVRGGSFNMQHNAKPQATGTAIANSVYTGLKGDK